MSTTTFVPGNRRALYIGLQTAKGTVQATPTLKLRVQDFSPNEVRQKIELEETDAQTMDGESVAVGVTPGFSFSKYLRPSEDDLLLTALLGQSTDTGAGPFTHTIIPTLLPPFLTVFEAEPGIMCNRYQDITIISATIRGGAGQALTVTYQCEALDFLAGATEPVTPALPVSELPLVYPEVTHTLGGVAPGTVDEFELTIARGGQRIQGDLGMKSQHYQIGKFVVTGSITKYVPNSAAGDDYQRAIDTGSKTGTVPTTAILTEALNIKALRNAGLSIEFDLDEAEYTTRQAGPRTDGSPLVEVLAFRTPPQPTLAGDLTAIVINSKATPQA